MLDFNREGISLRPKGASAPSPQSAANTNHLERANGADPEGVPVPDETPSNERRAARLLPATNVHPAVAIMGIACYAWILIMAWFVFDHGTTMLDLVISSLIFFMMLGLLLKLASMARNMTPERRTRRDFAAFLEGEVDTYTGRIPAQTAIIEILLPPVALALVATGVCIIAQIWSF